MIISVFTKKELEKFKSKLKKTTPWQEFLKKFGKLEPKFNLRKTRVIALNVKTKEIYLLEKNKIKKFISKFRILFSDSKNLFFAKFLKFLNLFGLIAGIISSIGTIVQWIFSTNKFK
ncbi:hypothetical protein MHSWG343_09090 [Candidatus Mycoplasma haematohominis]|uniref:Uncharacterized protein n=1 Tax=Candidatus Mycoplasma haematohominis TaxID=1494318 RepID=A0A478FR56_9MOLU|nr:hypothetical protein MHSWG343_09090 [Candidatus Mycoplasma haemohominis]